MCIRDRDRKALSDHFLFAVPVDGAICGVGSEEFRRPVSYTHLDVYKRQVRTQCDAPKSGRSSRSTEVTTAWESFIKSMDSATCAVSYTHLEVYKRQKQNMAARTLLLICRPIIVTIGSNREISVNMKCL